MDFESHKIALWESILVGVISLGSAWPAKGRDASALPFWGPSGPVPYRIVVAGLGEFAFLRQLGPA